MFRKKLNYRTVCSRINRKLRHEGERLRTLRGERGVTDLGRFFVVDERGLPTACHVDPETLARELGVLAAHETIAW
jgi:hypothetical protein